VQMREFPPSPPHNLCISVHWMCVVLLLVCLFVRLLFFFFWGGGVALTLYLASVFVYSARQINILLLLMFARTTSPYELIIQFIYLFTSSGIVKE
jgi:hypothetical protein